MRGELVQVEWVWCLLNGLKISLQGLSDWMNFQTDAQIIGNLLRGYDSITLEEIKIRVKKADDVYFIIKNLIKSGIIICFVNKDNPKGAYQLTTFGKELMGVEWKY